MLAIALDFGGNYYVGAGIVKRNMSMVVNQTMISAVIVFIRGMVDLFDCARVSLGHNLTLVQRCTDRSSVSEMGVRFKALLEQRVQGAVFIRILNGVKKVIFTGEPNSI